MSASMKSLGLDRLSVSERLALVEELWDSIVEEPESFSLTDAQMRDLDLRLEAHVDNPGTGSPWEEVKSRLLSENP